MPGTIVLAIGLFFAGVGTGASISSAYAARAMRRLRERLTLSQAEQIERISGRVLARLTAALDDD